MPINLWVMIFYYFLLFGVFFSQCFHIEKLLIISSFLSSSHQNQFKFASVVHNMKTLQCTSVYELTCFIVFCIFGVFSSIFTKTNIALEKLHLHIIILLYFYMIHSNVGGYISYVIMFAFTLDEL